MSDAAPLRDPRLRDRLAADVEDVLRLLGEDPEREGLVHTPVRVADSLRFLTSGYQQSLDEIIGGAVFAEEYEEMVLVKDIELYSLCEHHLLPFFGKAHVAYLPHGHILGLSKVARVVDVFARRLQVQERLTTQIAECIQSAIKPEGVGVVIEARHLCMMMRGVEKQHSSAVTSSMQGSFRDQQQTREEFLSLIRQKSSNGF